MARGRMVSRSLGSSQRFHALYAKAGKLAEFCQCLYPLLVANSDDFGRLDGDAFHVKFAVLPISPRSEADFERALAFLHSVGLIQLYDVEGIRYLQIANFDAHQQNLHKRSNSRIPEPPEVPGSSRKFPELPAQPNLTKPNLREPKEREDAPAQKPKRATQWPEEFTLTAESEAVALKHGVAAGRIPTVWEHFEAHHRAKGSQFVDWSRAWVTWVINEVKFNAGKGGAGPGDDTVARTARKADESMAKDKKWREEDKAERAAAAKLRAVR